MLISKDMAIQRQHLSPLLCEAVEEEKVKEGDTIILAAFGAGYTWASAAIRW